MRRLIGRTGSLLIFAPARAGEIPELPPQVPVADEGPALSPPAADEVDLWDPAGVPGPLHIAIESRVDRIAWRFWAGGRR